MISREPCVARQSAFKRDERRPGRSASPPRARRSGRWRKWIAASSPTSVSTQATCATPRRCRSTAIRASCWRDGRTSAERTPSGLRRLLRPAARRSPVRMAVLAATSRHRGKGRSPPGGAPTSSEQAELRPGVSLSRGWACGRGRCAAPARSRGSPGAEPPSRTGARSSRRMAQTRPCASPTGLHSPCPRASTA